MARVRYRRGHRSPRPGTPGHDRTRPTLRNGCTRVCDRHGLPYPSRRGMGGGLSTFLRKVGAAHIAATVLLASSGRHCPRSKSAGCLGAADIEAAIRLQIDSLHPFAEDDVFFTWARIPDSPSVLVGIARREVVDRLSATFAEAGIKVTAFTFSAAAIVLGDAIEACRAS